MTNLLSHKFPAVIITDYNCGEILTYEEVVKIAPQKNRPRPVVLVGKYKQRNVPSTPIKNV